MSVFKSQSNGSAITLALIMVGVVGLSSLSGALFFDYQRKMTRKSDLKETAEIFRSNAETLLNGRKDTWINTIKGTENTAAFGCVITSGSDCFTATGGNPMPIALKNGRNTIYFDSRAGSTNGITMSGLPCNSYSSAGNPQCPLRPIVEVKADCSAPPCLCPDWLFRIRFDYSPGTGLALSFDPKKSELDFGKWIRKSSRSMPACICRSKGGRLICRGGAGGAL